MTPIELSSNPERLGEFLIEGVEETDKRCCKIIDGTECGLVYVKEQFAADALRETGKKLTEELLLSWLLRDWLRRIGVSAELEERYPGTKRQCCDLFVHVNEQCDFAVEVKNAWKKWMWCDGSVHTSSAFKGYLLGDASHLGTAHDFDKLEGASWRRPTWLGVLQVGFDTFSAPMDEQISQLESKKQLTGRGWRRTAHRAWADRRNSQFRIACWFWNRPPTS